MQFEVDRPRPGFWLALFRFVFGYREHPQRNPTLDDLRQRYRDFNEWRNHP